MSLDPINHVIANNYAERLAFDPVFDPALLQGFTAISNSKAALDLAALNHHDAYAHSELALNKDTETRFHLSSKMPFQAFVNPDDIQSNT